MGSGRAGDMGKEPVWAGSGRAGEMEPYKQRIEDAMVRAEWAALIEPAEAWIHSLGGEHDPRPHFALNTVQLVRGEFGAAWETHAHCLQIGRAHV